MEMRSMGLRTSSDFAERSRHERFVAKIGTVRLAANVHRKLLKAALGEIPIAQRYKTALPSDRDMLRRGAQIMIITDQGH